MPPFMFSTFGDKETTLQRMKKHKSQENLRKDRSFKQLRKTKSKREIRAPYVCRETASTRMKQRDPHKEMDKHGTRQLMISDDFFFNRRLDLSKKSDQGVLRMKTLTRAKSQNRLGGHQGSRLRLSKIEILPAKCKKGKRKLQGS